MSRRCLICMEHTLGCHLYLSTMHVWWGDLLQSQTQPVAKGNGLKTSDLVRQLTNFGGMADKISLKLRNACHTSRKRSLMSWMDGRVDTNGWVNACTEHGNVDWSNGQLMSELRNAAWIWLAGWIDGCMHLHWWMIFHERTSKELQQTYP